jgi:hypothetical protein
MAEMSEIAPGRAERVIITGGTRCGKSCSADMFLRFLYGAFPSMEFMLLDTKPRFRAQYVRGIGGTSRDAAAHYSPYRKGPMVPNSVRVDLEADNPMRRVFKDEQRIAVLQSSRPGGSTHDERMRILQVAHDWWSTRTNGNPRYVIADEGMHFFQKNGYSIDTKRNLFHEIAQTGGELDTGMIFETQLLRGIDSMILDHLSRLYAYYLRDIRDIKRLFEVGIPKDYQQPEEDYAFHMITCKPGGRLDMRPNLQLELPDWYIRQLPPT